MKSHILTRRFLALLTTTACFFLCAKPVFAADTPGSVAAHDLAAPGAHNPGYDQKNLWPEDVKQTGNFKQKWQLARLLVWARTGDFTGPLKDPANWLENGKPAVTEPDENTDGTM